MADPLNQTSQQAPKRTEEERLGLSLPQAQVAGAQPGYLGQSYAYTGRPGAKSTGTGITQKTAGMGQYLSANKGHAQTLANRVVRGIGTTPGYSFGESFLDAGILGQATDAKPIAKAPAVSSTTLLNNLGNQAYGIARDAQSSIVRTEDPTADYQNIYNYLTNNSGKFASQANMTSMADIVKAMTDEALLDRQKEVQSAVTARDLGALQDYLTSGKGEGSFEAEASRKAGADAVAAARSGVDRATAEAKANYDNSAMFDALQKQIDAKMVEMAAEPNKDVKQAIGAEIRQLSQQQLDLNVPMPGGGRRQTADNVAQTAHLTKITKALENFEKMASGETVGVVDVGQARSYNRLFKEIGVDLKLTQAGGLMPDTINEIVKRLRKRKEELIKEHG